MRKSTKPKQANSENLCQATSNSSDHVNNIYSTCIKFQKNQHNTVEVVQIGYRLSIHFHCENA